MTIRQYLTTEFAVISLNSDIDQVGIPYEMQPFIFDHFTIAQQQGTSGEPSTGLGLYFSRKTVELHEGRIWFESDVVTGTTFFIELPKY